MRRLHLVLVVSFLGACQCAAPRTDLLFRCEADGGCSAGTRCALDGGRAGYCVPFGDGGSASLTAVDLVFDNADGGPLDAFPVLVALDAGTIDYAAVANPSTDLRFYDPDTDRDLPFQVDTWNPGGESIVWVLVPNVDAGVGDRITLFSGPNAHGAADPTGASVWGGSHTAVWHLGPGALTNSASASYRGTSMGAAIGAGQIGSGVHFTGTGDQRVTFDRGEDMFDGWGAFTLELWLRADSMPTPPDEDGVLDKGGGLNLGRVHAGSGSLRFQVDMHFTGSGNNTYQSTEVPLHAWTYVAYTFDGQTLTMYADGKEVAADSFGTVTMLPGRSAFYLGDTNGPIDGTIDEVRISRSARSADWVRAQHRSMTRRFISFSPR